MSCGWGSSLEESTPPTCHLRNMCLTCRRGIMNGKARRLDKDSWWGIVTLHLGCYIIVSVIIFWLEGLYEDLSTEILANSLRNSYSQDNHRRAQLQMISWDWCRVLLKAGNWYFYERMLSWNYQFPVKLKVSRTVGFKKPTIWPWCLV